MGGRSEVRVLEDRPVGGDRGGDPFDHRLVECPERASDRRIAVVAPDDQLADQVVVELADLVTGLVAGVEADAVAVGDFEPIDPAR